MKTKHFMTLFIMCSIFLAAELFGLYVTEQYVLREVPYGIEPPHIEEPYTPWTMLAGILIATVILYLMLKYRMDLFIKIWYVIAVTICISITFSLFISEIFAISTMNNCLRSNCFKDSYERTLANCNHCQTSNLTNAL